MAGKSQFGPKPPKVKGQTDPGAPLQEYGRQGMRSTLLRLSSPRLGVNIGGNLKKILGGY